MNLLHILLLIGFEFVQQSTSRECQRNELPCASGRCIKNEDWCDREYDCEDGSDELYCNDDPCREHLFQCQNKRCIPQSAVCNHYDNCGDGSDEICKGTPNHKPPAIAGVIKAAEYLLRMREPDYGWGSLTPRVLVALAFAEKVFSISEQEKALMKKRLHVEILLNLMRNEGKPSLVDLAHYINALHAMCQNPRSFHGLDLVGLLRSNTSRANFSLPLVLMTLCISGAQEANDAYKLISMYDDRSNDKTGFKALTVMSQMPCKSRYRHSLQKRMNEQARNFLQRLESGYGETDIYTEALSYQALNAMGRSRKIDLWTRQLADGSFGDLLSTYYAIPVLLNTSLLDLKCNGRKYDEMGLGISLSKFSDGIKKNIAYSLRMSPDEDFDSNTMTVTIEGNRTFYDVMKIAQSRDPMFRFKYDQTSAGKVVNGFGELPNDIEAGLTWTLYRKKKNSTKENGLQQERLEVEKIFPEDGSHYVFWRKRTI